MDSQVTRSRQRILESAVVLLSVGNLPGQLVELLLRRPAFLFQRQAVFPERRIADSCVLSPAQGRCYAPYLG